MLVYESRADQGGGFHWLASKLSRWATIMYVGQMLFLRVVGVIPSRVVECNAASAVYLVWQGWYPAIKWSTLLPLLRT